MSEQHWDAETAAYNCGKGIIQVSKLIENTFLRSDLSYSDSALLSFVKWYNNNFIEYPRLLEIQ